MISFLLIVFNVGVVSFLIYRMVDVVRRPVGRSLRAIVLIGGTLLLLAPLGMFFRFFAPTPQYFVVYPVAIFLFLYLTRQVTTR